MQTLPSKCPLCGGEVIVTRIHCLHEIIRALGYEPGAEELAPRISDEDRRRILESLEQGQISYQDAMRMLEGEV